jgi:CBS domain-containing protein
MIVSDWFRPNPVTCDVGETVARAAALMKEHGVGSVVVAAGGKPIGILTDRDIVIGVVAVGRDAGIARVGDVMTANPIVAHLSEDLLTVTERLSENGIRRLPVVDDEGSVVGMISFDDLVHVLSLALRNLGQTVVAEQEDEALAQGRRLPPAE